MVLQLSTDAYIENSGRLASRNIGTRIPRRNGLCAGDRCCRRLCYVPSTDLPVDLDRLAEVCGRYGVARLEVFGSVSRGDDRADSDVDILYELSPGTRLGWNIENLADDLAELFGRPVDLVSRVALHERLRPSVLAEAQVLYAA